MGYMSKGINNFTTHARAAGSSMVDAMTSNPIAKSAVYGAAGGAVVGGALGGYSDNSTVVGGMVSGATLGGIAGGVGRAYGPATTKKVGSMVDSFRK